MHIIPTLYGVPFCFLFVVRLKGRFFYRMVDDSLPQWIRTYPEDAAPRTGDGLFPGEVIEVAQVPTAAISSAPPPSPTPRSARPPNSMTHKAIECCFFFRGPGSIQYTSILQGVGLERFSTTRIL